MQAPPCASGASYRLAAYFKTRQHPLGLLLLPLPLLHLFLLPLCVLCDLCGRFWAPFTIHNIASKRALGIIALLRKNALFVGHKEGGENLAVLLTLRATCQLQGVNPEAWLADVLVRIWVRGVSMDEQLPWNWVKGGVVVPELRTAT